MFRCHIRGKIRDKTTLTILRYNLRNKIDFLKKVELLEHFLKYFTRHYENEKLTKKLFNLGDIRDNQKTIRDIKETIKRHTRQPINKFGRLKRQDKKDYINYSLI